jgi:hypothetical protein
MFQKLFSETNLHTPLTTDKINNNNNNNNHNFWRRSAVGLGRKDVGLIPDGENGIFHQLIPSGRPMTLTLLTEMVTSVIYWGKGGRCTERIVYKFRKPQLPGTQGSG